MCNFCILFDFSSAMAKVEQGIATIEKAPTDIPFLPKQQFNFCPVCGSPRDPIGLSASNRFPRNLKTIRRMRGFTQEALGAKLGIQKSAICKYEKGRAKPNVKQLAEMCRILDVSPQELI